MQATICYICKKPFTNNNVNDDETPCIDHNHITGVIHGRAHKECNKSFYSFFHNLSKYNSHLFMQCCIDGITPTPNVMQSDIGKQRATDRP